MIATRLAILMLSCLALSAPLPAATGPAATADSPQPATETVRATSDAGTVGWVSMPFIVFGLAVAAAYRRLVRLYQQWCLKRGLGQASAAAGGVRDDALTG
jgi:hypothetical protein